MTRLKQRIVNQIEALGPISVSEYMALCLSDPQHGYYMTRDPFGRDGDFTTAPEISQMFGELIGAWLVATWHALGRPKQPSIAEIGPGRGTLMKDMARTVRKLEPELRETARFMLIETSARLSEIQRNTLEGSGDGFEWHESIDELPKRPLLIVGNELFDAIPVRQYVKTPNGWRVRAIGLDDAGNLVFVTGPGTLDPLLLPLDAAGAPDGAIVELAPARMTLMQTIAARIARDGGAGLFIDYGYLNPAVGDTLQALLKHAYDDPLAHPGEADLTAHVDFSALATAARQAGLETHLSTQCDFLLGMGLLERAGRLGANADEATRERLSSEVERLAGPDQMGTLFKVLAVTPKGVATAPPLQFPDIPLNNRYDMNSEPDLNTFRETIVNVFPNIAGAEFSLLTKGWHSTAVDVDDRLIFKFPRSEVAGRALVKEAGLLAVIRPAVTMPVPDLTLHSGPPMFSRHEKLQGDHLVAEQYGKLAVDARQHLAGKMALFTPRYTVSTKPP